VKLKKPDWFLFKELDLFLERDKIIGERQFGGEDTNWADRARNKNTRIFQTNELSVCFYGLKGVFKEIFYFNF